MYYVWDILFMPQSRIISYIAGEYPEFTLEHRALNILNFSTALNFFFGSLFGFLLQMEFYFFIIQFSIGITIFSFFFMTRVKKMKGTMTVVSAFGILFLFLAGSISEGGLNGPAFGVGTGYFILFVSISANKRFTVINSTLYVLVLSTGLAIDYFFPEIIVNYKNEKQRHLDFVFNFFQTIIPVYFLFLSNRECYQYEQQQVEEKNKQLAIANTTKEKLFAIIGHDLRSPIASLDSLLLMLNEGRISEEELSLHLQQIQNKTGQIRDLLDNLLYWAVSQMEHLQTHPIELSLINIVETELSMLREQAAIKQLKIENNISINAIIVADSEQAKIILRNILTNAVRYTTNGGKITITTAEDKTQQKVIVTNSGKWNEEQTSTDTTDPKRTGFGLFLSKDFAKRNGGDLDIDKSSNEIVTVKWTATKP
jgi:signal transduction histidine kinase